MVWNDAFFLSRSLSLSHLFSFIISSIDGLWFFFSSFRLDAISCVAIGNYFKRELQEDLCLLSFREALFLQDVDNVHRQFSYPFSI